MNVSIFTVYVFREIVLPLCMDEPKTYNLDIHLVAGTDSKDAERRLKAKEGENLGGEYEAFITTDEHTDNYHAPAVRMYVNGGMKKDLTEEEFQSWKRVMCNGSWDSGDWHPAGVRSI